MPYSDPCKCESFEEHGRLQFRERLRQRPQSTTVVDCVCNVLNDYVDFATEEKKSDEDVTLLFNKIRFLIPSAIACQAQRIEQLADLAIIPKEDENWELHTSRRVGMLTNRLKHLRDPDLKNMNT